MLPLIAIALILLSVGTGTLAWALLIGRRARLERERRVGLIVSAPKVEAAPDTESVVKIQAKKFDRVVRHIFTLGMKHTWAMEIRSLTLLLVAAVSGEGVWVVTKHVFGLAMLPSIGLSVSASYLLPRFLLARQQKRLEVRFMDLFPDGVDTIARMLRAGLPMTMAVWNVATNGAPPVSTVFSLIADQLKIGIPLDETLDTSSRDVGLADFRFFAVAVTLQYSTGGNLTTTLEILSDIMRKRRAARMKAKAATGEIRMTAYTLGAIPFLTIGALLVIQPSYLVPLWTDPRGHLILAMAGLGLFLAYFTMRVMMRSVTNVG